MWERERGQSCSRDKLTLNRSKVSLFWVTRGKTGKMDAEMGKELWWGGLWKFSSECFYFLSKK